MVVCITTKLQHFCNVTLPNILVNVAVSSASERKSIVITLTVQPRIHVITCDDFTALRNLVIGYFADIIIADLTAGQRN